MSRLPSFAVKSTSKGWLVHVPASVSDTGKMSRRYFPNRESAKAFAKDLRTRFYESGIRASTLPPRVADDAVAALGLLAPKGLSLREAARDLVAAMDALRGSGTVLEAARAFRAAHDARTASKPLREAVSSYFSHREDLRDSTLKSYRYTLEGVLGPLADSIMAAITTDDIEGLMRDKGPTARKMHRRNIRVFWKWASSPPRSWATMDAVDALEAVRVSNDEDIVVLAPSEVEALLRAAETEGSAAALCYAISVFAGVRMGELAKLRWSDIRQNTIEIGKSIAKKHTRRSIPICETLRAWIDAHRDIDAAPAALIVPPNWVEISKCVRRRAGWNVVARRLNNPPEPTRGSWPANAPRHTCASVQVAIGTPIADLVFKFGHSGGIEMLRSHYVSRMERSDADAILAIRPLQK
jgi:integrase